MAASLSLGLFGAPAQGAVRAGKNFRLSPASQNPDPGFLRGKDAVGLAVNPGNAQQIVEVNADWVTGNCEFASSTDGGSTWKGGIFTSPPGFRPTCRVPSHLADSMYAGVAFGSGQNVYATFVTPRGTVAAEESASTLVAKSTNGGQTFGTPVVVMNGGATGAGPNYELPELGVEPGAGPGGADRVYVTAHQPPPNGGTNSPGNATTVVSNDGGATFSAPVNANPVGEGVTDVSEPVIAGNGNVYLAWRQIGKNPANPAQTIPEGFVRVAKSTDKGASWTPVSVAAVSAAGAKTPTRPENPLPATASTFPRLAVDKQNNNLYLTYGQGTTAPTGLAPADHFIDPDSDVYFQRSTTGGATWSAPKQINDGTPKPGTPTTQTRHPSISVAPNGRVDIVWQDRRNWYRGCIHTHGFCAEARLGDTYYAFSNDNGSNFSRDRRITDRSHNNDTGFDYRFGVGWAFGPMAVPIGNDQLLVGWMDSREGNFDNDNLDIYLSKVDLNAPASVPQDVIKEQDATALSTTLSSFTYPGGGEGLLAATFASRKGAKVVIVNDKDVPGALAGGVLARGNLSQVLLSPAAGLPASVKAEVSRLKPAGAYIVGNGGFLSGQIDADLAAAGVPANTITRLPGADNASNARLIAQALDRRSPATGDTGAPAFDAAVLANPASPDASAAAGLAAERRLPFLYVDQGSIPPATQEALTSLGINKTLVIGGTQSVSDAVMGQLPSPKRLGGADQYATSQAVVAESKERGVPDNIAYVADGDSPMDAALAGAAVGRLGGLLLLSRQPLETTGPTTADALGLTAGLDRIIPLQTVAPTVGPGPGGPTATNPIPIVTLPALPSLAQILKALKLDLSGLVKALQKSTLQDLLRKAGFTAKDIDVLMAGKLTIDLTEEASKTKSARVAASKKRLLARGVATFTKAGKYKVKVKLTSKGKKAFKKAIKKRKSVRATLTMTFKDSAGRVSKAAKMVTLKPAKKKKKKKK